MKPQAGFVQHRERRAQAWPQPQWEQQRPAELTGGGWVASLGRGRPLSPPLSPSACLQPVFLAFPLLRPWCLPLPALASPRRWNRRTAGGWGHLLFPYPLSSHRAACPPHGHASGTSLVPGSWRACPMMRAFCPPDTWLVLGRRTWTCSMESGAAEGGPGLSRCPCPQPHPHSVASFSVQVFGGSYCFLGIFPRSFLYFCNICAFPPNR